MNEWREAVLRESLDVKHGYAFKGEYFADDGELIVVTPGNFLEGGGFKPKSGSEKYYVGPVPEGYLLHQDDVVVAMTEQAEGLLGSSATIPESDRYLHNQRIGLLQVTDPSMLDQRFCYHLMNTPWVRRQIRATATGTKVRHTAPERIRAVRVALPDVETQRSIAGVLDRVDGFIENNRRRVKVLEEMAKAIYREWFVRFRFPGFETTTFVDSSAGLLPEGWSITPLRELVEIPRDTVDASDVPAQLPAVGLEHIPRRQLTLDDWGHAGELQSRKTKFVSGDVLFGKIRPYFHKVSVAPMDGICSTDAIVIRPCHPYWGLVVMTVSSADFVSHATQTSTGTKMPRADWKVIGEYQVAVPPEHLAEIFTEVVQSHLGAATNLMRTSRNLATMRDLLLPKLVTGQIDVSRLDLDAMVEATA